MQTKPMICMTSEEYAELMHRVRAADKIIKDHSWKSCGELIDYWYAKYYEIKKNEVKI